MAITNYTNLKTTLADYLHRSDLSDTVLSNFVQFAESRLNRKLRLLQQETTTTLSVPAGTNTIALPSDWIETIDVIHSDDKDSLTAQSVKNLNSQTSYGSTTGRPRLYAITNGYNLLFNIITDKAYDLSLNYFNKWDVETDDTNWLLQNAPDAYLYASLLEAKAYTKKLEDVGLWSSGLDVAINDLNRNDNRSRRNATSRVDSAIIKAGRFDINRGY
tara:strand:- start:26 stop:676 length:651 start_codon:yes stop_codon:yes gene_type:complete